MKKSQTWAILNPLHNFPSEMNLTKGPFSGGLPKKIEVGEEFRVYFPLNHGGLRDSKIIDVGFHDTFGRYNWAPRKHVAAVINQIRKHFPKTSET
ncbi:hypothetical protein [Phyllobacterium phragmitis]|uniref:hypothetical protein n=1 Tax=Phyllobacterium phragmitis TaxID=2670329 RepID=UPI0011B25A91|nr:hypothetical protein [Phyllobacterium phragmitis]